MNNIINSKIENLETNYLVQQKIFSFFDFIRIHQN